METPALSRERGQRKTVESRKFVDTSRMHQEKLDCGVLCIGFDRASQGKLLAL